MTHICAHCFVSGRVQGVFYRHFVYENALKLAITGWVRNVSDGRVEALLCGEKEGVETLIHRLWEGPPAASVTAVQSKEIAFEEHKEFKVEQ